MDRLSELLGAHVQFSYTALDRIVLNGYIERLQRPGNIAYFFQEVAGVECIEPAVLAGRTKVYRQWLGQYVQEQGIALIQAPKGARKEDLVLPYYRKLGGREGVACVLTSMEQGRTFLSYTPRYPLRGAPNPNYRKIVPCRKQFQHYYFYVFDLVMGPMSLRVATYLHFNISCYLNGHSFLAQELSRHGIRFRKEDNAFLAVEEEAALEEAHRRLTPELLRERCDYWAARLAPGFSREERAAINPSYRYSVAQVELATDVIFKRSARLQARFQRAADIGLLLGGADRTTHLFGRRINRRFQGKLQLCTQCG